MSEPMQRLVRNAQDWALFIGMTVITLAAILASAALFAAAAGALPWPAIPISIAGSETFDIGPPALLGLCLVLVSLCAFLPAAIRVRRLEATHRDFALRMEDVARAYWAAHRADRTGIFRLEREFDAVRERALFLANHPDLGELDHSLVELASQMSTESRELARIYSDEKVARARDTLARRTEDVVRLERQIEAAHGVCTQLKRDLDAVEVEEAVIRSRLARLDAELAELHRIVDPAPASGGARAGRPKLRIAPGE